MYVIGIILLYVEILKKDRLEFMIKFLDSRVLFLL